MVGGWAALPRPAEAPQDRDLFEAPRALPLERPLRLTVLGTSLTAGAGWPEAVAEALGACLDSPVELTRIARPGAGSDWGLTQVPAVADSRPDLVVIEFAINDADLRDGSFRGKALDRHRRLVEAVRDSAGDPGLVLMTTSPARGPRGWIRPFLAGHYADYRLLAEELDLGLADLHPRWQALPRAERGLDRDGLHPRPEVAREIVLPVLVPLLGRAYGADCPG